MTNSIPDATKPQQKDWAALPAKPAGGQSAPAALTLPPGDAPPGGVAPGVELGPEGARHNEKGKRTTVRPSRLAPHGTHANDHPGSHHLPTTARRAATGHAPPVRRPTPSVTGIRPNRRTNWPSPG